MEITAKQLEVLESNTGYNNQHQSLIGRKEYAIKLLTELFIDKILTDNEYGKLCNKVHRRTEKQIYELRLRIIDLLKL